VFLSNKLRKDVLKGLLITNKGAVLLGKKLGDGYSRVVFVDPRYPARVIKLAISANHVDQNISEESLYTKATLYQRSVLARIFEISSKGFMLNMEKVDSTLDEIDKCTSCYKEHKKFYSVVNNLHITDLHTANIGVKNNRLKIIDYAHNTC